MMTRHWAAWDHIDRIESLVYDALFNDRLAPDPSQVPPRARTQQPDRPKPSSGLRFLDGN